MHVADHVEREGDLHMRLAEGLLAQHERSFGVLERGVEILDRELGLGQPEERMHGVAMRLAERALPDRERAPHVRQGCFGAAVVQVELAEVDEGRRRVPRSPLLAVDGTELAVP